MFVVYSSDTDVIVTTKKKEETTRHEFFVKGDRNFDDYDRQEVDDVAVEIRPVLRVR